MKTARKTDVGVFTVNVLLITPGAYCLSKHWPPAERPAFHFLCRFSRSYHSSLLLVSGSRFQPESME